MFCRMFGDFSAKFTKNTAKNDHKLPEMYRFGQFFDLVDLANFSTSSIWPLFHCVELAAHRATHAPHQIPTVLHVSPEAMDAGPHGR